jgi:Domain of unknown function (DUF1707)/Cell wall-active antibiotics response 4TMS YvqF
MVVAGTARLEAAMGDTTDGRPAGGIRASDAERDATVERLSRAAGDGRLTLEEFSQRMEQATSAKTRAELDRLTADLPAEPAAAVARAGPASAPASWHVWPVGGLRVSGPWRMARHVIVASIVGGTWLDLTQAQLAAPEVTLTTVSLVGRTQIIVPPGIGVQASGFSLVGGTTVEAGPEPGPGAPTVYVRAFSLVGGVTIQRSGPRGDRGPRGDWRAEREDRRAERRDWRADRRAERRSRRGRPGYSFG